MATEGGGGMDLFTFLLALIIIGVLVQAGYSALKGLVSGPAQETAPQAQIVSTTTPDASFDTQNLPTSERY